MVSYAISAVAVATDEQATLVTSKAPGFIVPAVGPQSTKATFWLAQHPVPHPHWLGTPPPPHCWPVGHVPQSRVPPQPSEAEPQLSPSSAHVFGTQAQ
jgi:hypothetical protein